MTLIARIKEGCRGKTKTKERVAFSVKVDVAEAKSHVRSSGNVAAVKRRFPCGHHDKHQ